MVLNIIFDEFVDCLKFKNRTLTHSFIEFIFYGKLSNNNLVLWHLISQFKKNLQT